MYKSYYCCYYYWLGGGRYLIPSYLYITSYLYFDYQLLLVVGTFNIEHRPASTVMLHFPFATTLLVALLPSEANQAGINKHERRESLRREMEGSLCHYFHSKLSVRVTPFRFPRRDRHDNDVRLSNNVVVIKAEATLNNNKTCHSLTSTQILVQCSVSLCYSSARTYRGASRLVPFMRMPQKCEPRPRTKTVKIRRSTIGGTCHAKRDPTPSSLHPLQHGFIENNDNYVPPFKTTKSS